MREQLAAAEKARKDARAAFVHAKNRFAVKQGDVTSPPAQDNGDDHAPAEHRKLAEVATEDHVTNGGNDETRSISLPAISVLEPILPESENKRDQVDEQVNKASDDRDEVNKNVALVADGDRKRENPEADRLRNKLEVMDMEVYEVRAKLMVRDMEADELRVELKAKDTNISELTTKLVAKDTEIAALRASNAALAKTVSEATRESTESRAREAENALRESAAREAQLAERLAASERAREQLEAEARRSSVQSEQWRKAAEEAAAVLGGAPGGKDMRRHGSVGSTNGKMDMQDDVDGEGSGRKRKSGGAVRLLADLWKKKTQK
nr:interactor of constitutive active ROPs 1-like [Lolium perenne]